MFMSFLNYHRSIWTYNRVYTMRQLQCQRYCLWAGSQRRLVNTKGAHSNVLTLRVDYPSNVFQCCRISNVVFSPPSHISTVEWLWMSNGSGLCEVLSKPFVLLKCQHSNDCFSANQHTHTKWPRTCSIRILLGKNGTRFCEKNVRLALKHR